MHQWEVYYPHFEHTEIVSAPLATEAVSYMPITASERGIRWERWSITTVGFVNGCDRPFVAIRPARASALV